jgi:S-(hydroxymethyl)glutathione dehydrogenase/alcohol dehydrogenase
VLVQRYLEGDIDADAFVSHRLSLDEVNRGFELMEAQDGIRSVLTFA